MPKASTSKAELTFKPVYEEVGGVRVPVGVQPSGVIYFRDFNPEKQGMKYDIPVKARGNNGKCAPVAFDASGNLTDAYESLPLIKVADQQMYVKKNGELTANPWVNGVRSRGVLEDVFKISKQATPNSTWMRKVIDPTITWPDGFMRSYQLKIKANAPQLPEDFIASRKQTDEKKQATSVNRIDPAKLHGDAAKMLIYKAIKLSVTQKLKDGEDWAEATRVALENIGQNDLIPMLEQEVAQGQQAAS